MAADESVLELLREPWQRFDEHWPHAPAGAPREQGMDFKHNIVVAD
jgi:hypothetical protein